MSSSKSLLTGNESSSDIPFFADASPPGFVDGEDLRVDTSTCVVGKSPFFPSNSPNHHPSRTSLRTRITSPTSNDSSSFPPLKLYRAVATFLSCSEGGFKILACDLGEPLSDFSRDNFPARDRKIITGEFLPSSSTLSRVSLSFRDVNFSFPFLLLPVTDPTALDAQSATLIRAVLSRSFSLSFSFSFSSVLTLSARFLEVAREEGREEGLLELDALLLRRVDLRLIFDRISSSADSELAWPSGPPDRFELTESGRLEMRICLFARGGVAYTEGDRLLLVLLGIKRVRDSPAHT